MSYQLTLWDSPNVTSSPVSVFGATPCAAPDGPTIDPCGQAPVLVNLSARQAKEMGLLTSGTYGLRSSTSLASATLTSYLVNKLRQKTALLCSTLYKLTWKERVSPAGRSIHALRASVLRISDKDCTGLDLTHLATPRCGDVSEEKWETKQARNARHLEAGKMKGVGGMTLPMMAHACGWQTPTTRDHKDGAECANVPINSLLGRVVWLTGLPTPQARDWKGPQGRAYKGESLDLPAVAKLMAGPARLTASGELLIGSCAGMKNGGQLKNQTVTTLYL